MRRAFDAAALVDDFDHLIPTMTCHAKDRHVLAAAVRGGADTLVTFNLKDFPPESTDRFGITVVHPDVFLSTLLAQRPDDVIASLERGTADLHRPAQTVRQFLESLTGIVPRFARLAVDAVEPFTPNGGMRLVFNWLIGIAQANPSVELIWGSLEDSLRLCLAQSWLLETGEVTADDPHRDAHAEQLAARHSTHPRFETFYDGLLAHYQRVYEVLDGRPCAITPTDGAVGVDLELVAFTCEAYAGEYDEPGQIPGYTFITRHLREDEWVIAATARRLPVPGWPPTEQVIPGLRIDGHAG